MTEDDTRQIVDAFVVEMAREAMLHVACSHACAELDWMRGIGAQEASIAGMAPATWRFDTVGRITAVICQRLPADRRTVVAIRDACASLRKADLITH